MTRATELFSFSFQVYQSLISKRLEAGEDPFPITYCQRVPKNVYEKEKTSGVESAMTSLLKQIVDSNKLSEKEKRKKLTKFKEEYPNIYYDRFPTEESEPRFMQDFRKKSSNSFHRLSSLAKIRSVMRI